ncbi:MAG: hypothetical protein K6G16_05950 [Lachnospiraceae bacterium]|nr:hypothetical protein [Lachnospiraceae bacterium]
MAAYDQVKEVNEAIRAGENALQSLYRAQEMLDKARTWGIFDIFGGNLITGIMKHSRLQEASRYMEEARRDLSYFQQELRDVQAPGLSSIAGDFLTFADFFFDGFIADILVQSKINEARGQCAEAIRRTQELLTRLRQYQ